MLWGRAQILATMLTALTQFKQVTFLLSFRYVFYIQTCMASNISCTFSRVWTLSSKQGCTVLQWAKPRAACYDAGKIAALQVKLLFSAFLGVSLTPFLPSATYLRATHCLSWGRHLPSIPIAKIPFYELPGLLLCCDTSLAVSLENHFF